jgi:hypothetical protein
MSASSVTTHRADMAEADITAPARRAELQSVPTRIGMVDTHFQGGSASPQETCA